MYLLFSICCLILADCQAFWWQLLVFLLHCGTTTPSTIWWRHHYSKSRKHKLRCKAESLYPQTVNDVIVQWTLKSAQSLSSIAAPKVWKNCFFSFVQRSAWCACGHGTKLLWRRQGRSFTKRPTSYRLSNLVATSRVLWNCSSTNDSSTSCKSTPST